MDPYNFNDFLKRMANFDYNEIISEAEKECARVEQSSSRVRGAVKRRKMGSYAYAQKIKEFLFFYEIWENTFRYQRLRIP